MKTKIPYLLLFFVVFKLNAQKVKPTVLKSTITSVGSTSVYSVAINSKNYEIQQSIGQSGIIGKKKNGNLSIQQGFLTNIKIFNINNSNVDLIDESLDLVISPNPFIDHIKIKFSQKTKYDIHIIVYDTNGKVLFSKKFKATDNLHIPMKYYTIGSYIIRVQSGNDKFTKKLLKVEQK